MPGQALVSAGDNAIVVLAPDAERVMVVDLSPAQITCLRLRMTAFRTHEDHYFLTLMGAQNTAQRGELLARELTATDAKVASFCRRLEQDVIADGGGGSANSGTGRRYFA